MNSSLTIKILYEIDFQEVLALVSENGFLPYSDNPLESTLASVYQYQKHTKNNDFAKVIAFYDDDKIVGVLFLVVFELKFKNKIFNCVQGSSGYVKPEYRGGFKMFTNKMIETYPNSFLLFMFSAPAVHKTALNFGFEEVCVKQFEYNNYILLKPFSFLKSSINNLKLKKSIKFISKLDVLFHCFKKNHNFSTYQNHNFKGDYSLIEQDYNNEYYDNIIPVWNFEVLKVKYLKTTIDLEDKSLENASYHFVVENDENKIIGSLVARKIANYNRLVIVEIHTIIDQRKVIVFDLINFLVNKACLIGYEAIMFNGIGDEYEKIIKKMKFVLRKKSKLKVFLKSNFKDEMFFEKTQVRFFYSTDDMNF